MTMDVLNQDSQLIITLMIDQQFFLKRYVFEHSAWFFFCHIFRLSVTYKIRIKYFDAIFLLNSPKKVSCLSRKLFYDEAILLVVILVYQSIFSPKTFSVK